MPDTTMNDRFNEWRTSRTRWAKQITDSLGAIWMKEWYNELKKKLISIWRNNLFADQIAIDTVAWQNTYTVPLGTTDTRPLNGLKDFVSVIQLEVAYELDQRTNLPVYHVCEQVMAEEFSDKKWEHQWKDKPRFEFYGKNQIVIFPTPKISLDQDGKEGIKLRYNYWEEDIAGSTKEKDINMPFYLLDTLDYYLDFRLKRHETDRANAQIEYDMWVNEIKIALWMINTRDSRPVKEVFMDTRFLQ